MPLLAIDWNPRDGQLRQFALGVAVFCLLLAGWLWREEALPAAVWTLAMLGAGVGLLGLAWPDTVRYLYLAAMVVTYPIGWIVSHLVLGLIYYGLFTPLGLAFRLMGRDALQRKFDPAAKTYWQPRRQATHPGQYLRQF